MDHNDNFSRRVERAISQIWGVAWLKGCLRGRRFKYINSYLADKNIAMILIGDEIVLISKRDAKLYEFARVKDGGTVLGKEITMVLEAAKLISRKKISANFWTCKICGKKEEFNPGIIGEVDSVGSGAEEVAEKIIRRHSELSPDCPGRIKVFLNMVEQQELTKLLNLEKVK